MDINSAYWQGKEPKKLRGIKGPDKKCSVSFKTVERCSQYTKHRG